MLHADHRFQHAVAEKVAHLEKRTDAEVVVVAAGSSGQYRDLAQVFGAVAAIGTFVLLLALPVTIHPLLAIFDIAFTFVVVSWAVSGHRLTAWLASADRKLDQVRRAAAAEFHLEAVHATPLRTGLLVYVSAWEGKIELIPDVGLEARIPRGRWAEALQRFSAEDLPGFLAGLDAVGELLVEYVPHTGARKLDLDDAPRIR
ncbi:MAG: hypothetical protein AAF211_23185 [Myxococcota bacterium]